MFGSLVTGPDARLWDEFRRLEAEMNQLFDGDLWPASIRAVRRGSFPAINIGASEDRVDVYVFAPGLDPKSLEVSVQQNLLTVGGSRRLQTPEQAEVHRRERFDGEFRRMISLPDDVDPERVEAKYRDGVLRISVPRRESAKPRQITVN